MKEQLSARLRASFVAELEEQVRVMNADLLALERDPRSADRLRSLFRVVHTLKGAARAANVPEIERVCHALEAQLARARDGRLVLTPPAFPVLFAVADAFADAHGRLARGELLEETAIATVGRQIPGLRLAPPAAEAATPAAPGLSAPAPARAAAPADRPVAGQIRVDPGTLDAVLAATTDLRQARSRVGGIARALRAELTRVAHDHRALRALDELDERLRGLGGAVDEVTNGVTRLRMRPFADICDGLPRVARDIATEERKDVALTVAGGDAEADRAVLDALREPIVHLVRNAVSHGVEAPARREAAGKPGQAAVRVGATLRGERFVVTVSDDGAGIDVDDVRRAAAQGGREVPRDDAALARALFGGGISTRRDAGLISGRGVGLDLVRAAVEGMGGSVRAEWISGQGTTVTLDCPLRLASIRVVVVAVGEHVLAIPTAGIERLLRVIPEHVGRAEGRDVFSGRDGIVTIVPLARVLGAPYVERAAPRAVPAIQLRSDARRLAVTVDALLDECEVMVRPLDVRRRLVLVTGVALVGSGAAAPVLNPTEVVAAGLRAEGGSALRPAPEAPARRRILIVDDSITTRMLEQHVLDAAGYHTTTAVDGAEAWRLLQAEPVDLVVADVEMPRMDGFALCRAIRGSERYARLPIVLVTALETAEQRAMGLESGADAYIGKSSFDQQTLLDVVRRFLE